MIFSFFRNWVQDTVGLIIQLSRALRDLSNWLVVSEKDASVIYHALFCTTGSRRLLFIMFMQGKDRITESVKHWIYLVGHNDEIPVTRNGISDTMPWSPIHASV